MVRANAPHAEHRVRLQRAWVVPALLALQAVLIAQAPSHEHQTSVALQPFAVLARSVVTTLDYLGQPLPAADREALEKALALADERRAVAEATAILDRHALVHVGINPESRVKVVPGAYRILANLVAPR